MRKDPDLKHTEWAKHTRNTAKGKAGVNRSKRRTAKRNPCEDASTQPLRKRRKRYGIRCGAFYKWYATKRARDMAFEYVLDVRQRMASEPALRSLMYTMQPQEKVER